MDLASLVTMCSIAFDRGMMQSLVWEETQGRPWSFRLSTDQKPRSYSSLSKAIEAARTAQPSDGTIRVGLTGLEVDLSVASAQPNEAMFAPCPNVTIASERLHALEDRCAGKAEFKSNPMVCAIAAWHASFENPDWKFADAVMIGAITSSTPDPEVPNELSSSPESSDRIRTATGEGAEPSPPPPLMREIQASDGERQQREFERAGGALFPANPIAGIRAKETKSSALESASGADSVSPLTLGNGLFIAVGRRRDAQ
ncbi:MAG TPA: hypothetical protein VKZ79_18300 [Alphaproteobacteria bacterium]|nr:hypothetical protein [Alphaproteobacteria bacterium]